MVNSSLSCSCQSNNFSQLFLALPALHPGFGTFPPPFPRLKPILFSQRFHRLKTVGITPQHSQKPHGPYRPTVHPWISARRLLGLASEYWQTKHFSRWWGACSTLTYDWRSNDARIRWRKHLRRTRNTEVWTDCWRGRVNLKLKSTMNGVWVSEVCCRRENIGVCCTTMYYPTIEFHL